MVRALLALPGLGEMRDDIGLPAARATAFSVTSSGSPGPDADAEKPPAHSPSLANALTAAAVMALPPIRPRTIS